MIIRRKSTRLCASLQAIMLTASVHTTTAKATSVAACVVAACGTRIDCTTSVTAATPPPYSIKQVTTTATHMDTAQATYVTTVDRLSSTRRSGVPGASTDTATPPRTAGDDIIVCAGHAFRGVGSAQLGVFTRAATCAVGACLHHAAAWP